MAAATYVNELLKYLVRAFHGPECGIVLDALLRANRCIKDDELAATLKLQQKQVRKVLFTLKGEHIVTYENRNKEALKQGERSTAHLHWFVDYKNAVDCVKYRIHQITKKFTEEKNRELQVQTYVCKQCKNGYSSLDAYTLQENGWRCEHCCGELEEVSAAESVSKTQNQVKTLWTQLKPITDALKRVESHPIPKFPKTSAAAMLAGLEDTNMLITTAGSGPVTGGGLGIGGSGHGNHGTRNPRDPSTAPIGNGQLDVFVDIVGSSQNGAPSQNGAAKPAPKAPLPWMQSQNVQQQTSLITTQPIVETPTASASSSSSTGEMDKETYEQYVKQYMEEYQKQQQAEMAKQHKLQTAQQSPNVTGQKHKSNGHLVKEEAAGSDVAERKRVKVEGEGAGVAQREVKREEEVKKEEENVTQEFEGEETAAAPAGEEPMVSIGNQQFPISQITDDQHGLMTPEEYEAYYKVYMAYYFQNQ